MKFFSEPKSKASLVLLICLLTAGWVRPPPSVIQYHGAVISLKPIPKRLAVRAELANRGTRTVLAVKGRGYGWRLCAFNGLGRPLAAAGRALTTETLVTLRPGASLTRTFTVGRYCRGERTGMLYIYVVRWMAVNNGLTSALMSPIHRLRFRKGQPPAWKIVPSIPMPRPGAKARVRKGTPPYPPHIIPKTGPVAALARIARAVDSGNVSKAEALCLPEQAVPQPLIAAMAVEAVNLARLRAVILKQFGVDWCKGMEDLHPSPAEFPQFLEELNPQTLKIRGNKASVGTVYYNGKAFVPFPGFDFRFRKIRSHWLVDSWATYRHISTPARYRQNVIGDLREARLFRSLTDQIKAGRFTNLHEVLKSADRRLAVEDDWFTLQSMKNNKQWMKNNAQWVKRVEKSEQASGKASPQTQP